MSDMISKINDDMEEYEMLCQKYNEEPRYTKDAYGNSHIDCYSKHASFLKDKNNNAYREELEDKPRPRPDPFPSKTSSIQHHPLTKAENAHYLTNTAILKSINDQIMKASNSGKFEMNLNIKNIPAKILEEVTKQGYKFRQSIESLDTFDKIISWKD